MRNSEAMSGSMQFDHWLIDRVSKFANAVLRITLLQENQGYSENESAATQFDTNSSVGFLLVVRWRYTMFSKFALVGLIDGWRIVLRTSLPVAVIPQFLARIQDRAADV